uniref:Helicase n=1 Tax=viral metagenome TaxID=1070528 RepID=A0A6C0KFZ2_9ZZZZ
MSAFAEYGLSDEVLRGIFSYGFEEPSAIQQRVIPQIIAGNDCLAQSPSGTGKTGAYGIGLIHRMVTHRCNAIVVVHTRELARQIETVASSLAQYIADVAVVCCTGGSGSHRKDTKRLRSSPLFLMIATPGRCLDILRKDAFVARTVGALVLDEADELVNPSFQETLRGIFSVLPADALVCVVSATVSDDLRLMSRNFLREGHFVHETQDCRALVLSGIRQYKFVCQNVMEKITALERMYQTWSIGASMIFCDSRSKVDWLGDQMESRGYAVGRIHAGLSDEDRRRVMGSFRSGAARVLICTNLLARGIDVQKVELVVLYDMIAVSDTYLHAIGRCGRYGRKGVSVAFVENTADDLASLDRMQAKFGVTVDEVPPTLCVPEMCMLDRS